MVGVDVVVNNVEVGVFVKVVSFLEEVSNFSGKEFVIFLFCYSLYDFGESDL